MRLLNILGMHPHGPQTQLNPHQKQGSLTYRLKKTYRYEVDMAIDQWKEALRLHDDPHLPDSRALLDLYRQSMLDAQLSALVQTRKIQALGAGYELHGVPNTTLNTLDGIVEKALMLAMDAVFYGHSLLEFVLDSQGQPTGIDLIDRQYVVPAQGVVRPNPDQPNQTIDYRKAPYDQRVLEAFAPNTDALLLKAVPYVIWKRYAHSDWSRHSEKYGMPFMVIRTQSRDERELDAKADMAARMGSNGYAILDEQDDITLLESNQSNPSDIYKKHIETCDLALNKLVLGQTMTTEAGSSRAQAEVHERVLNAYAQADRRFLEKWINQTLLPKWAGLAKHNISNLGFTWKKPKETDLLV